MHNIKMNYGLEVGGVTYSRIAVNCVLISDCSFYVRSSIFEATDPGTFDITIARKYPPGDVYCLSCSSSADP
jgi:hypothetical protein